MPIFLLTIALLVGIFLAEITFRIFMSRWLRRRLPEIVALLHAFRQAEGDDARQALLLRTGCATLKFSLLGFGLLSSLALFASLPPWRLQWTESQQMLYVIALSIVGTLWWVIRRQLCTADHEK